MKRLVLALAVVFTAVLAMVGVALARNQLPESERVVMDAVYMVFPPGSEGYSVELDAGALSMSVQLVGEGPTRPVHFGLMGYRGSDDAATIALDLSASNPTQVVTRQLAGGLYNVIMENRWPVSPNAGLATTSNYAQRVRVRMVYGSATSPAEQPLVAIQAAAASQPTVEEKAAAIKAGLLASITRFHNSLRGEVADFLQQDDGTIKGPDNSYNQALIGAYFDAITPVARDDAMLGWYLRYMAPVIGMPPFAKTLLEDRFLDHFSQSVASTGLPPVFPALTDAEIKKANIPFWMAPPPKWQTTFPYSWSGSALLGR